MRPVEQILAKLPDAKQSGKGWSARCPAHGDQRASLSIGEGDDGRALVKCHAGCKAEVICAAVGLTVLDLMPTAGKLPKRSTPQRNGKPKGKTFATAHDAVAELERRHGPRSAMWTYRNAHGEPVGVVVRWDLPNGEKDIRPASQHGDGWRIGGMPEPRPLYGLPDLADAHRVFVCEGEKAADAVRGIALAATTSAHGCESSGKADWRPLAGKEIILLPDNDKSGRKYVEAVATLLAKLTPAPEVKLVELPNLPDKGDVCDWLAAGGTKDELLKLANAAPEWMPTAAMKPGPILTCLADVEPRPVSWLWHGRIPLGRITLLVGRPGEGKSFLTTDMAARVTTGTPWPDGSECPQGSVILISAEDDPADTIRPRLDAHYADVRRVHLLSAVRRVDDDGQHDRMISLVDVDAIEAALSRLPDCKLIVVDPIGSFLGVKADANRDNEVRGILAPIAALAEKHGAAVLVVAHRRKSTGSSADDLALGSRAFTGIARAVWHLSSDAENKARRLLLPGKNNLAREGDGLAFSIIGDPPRIAWERDPVAMSADDALMVENQSREQNSGPEAEAFNAAREWLRSALAGGPRLAKDLTDEWCNGHDGSKTTLNRAKRSLCVKAYRLDVPGPWWWRLPVKDANASNDVQLGNLGNLAVNTGVLTNSDADECKDAKLNELGNRERVRVTI